jgi:hypothetical protein
MISKYRILYIDFRVSSLCQSTVFNNFNKDMVELLELMLKLEKEFVYIFGSF